MKSDIINNMIISEAPVCREGASSALFSECGRLETAMKFTDESCFSCGRKFDEKDDIVVCPECGTPYHRECYAQSGDCINTQLHENGGKWKSSAAEKEKTQNEAIVICPMCMQPNSVNDEICSKCGYRLKENDASSSHEAGGIKPEAIFGDSDNPFFKPYLGFNPEEDLGGATLKEVSDFVDSNTLYYVPLFKKMKDAGTKVSLNLSSFLFPYFYFANRKMWLWGILTAIISIILELPATLYTLGAADMSWPYFQDVVNVLASKENILLAASEACAMISWIFRLVVCFFANWLYFRFTVRSIKKIKLNNGGHAEQSKLKAAGGVKPLNMIYMLLVIMGISLAVSIILLAVLTAVQRTVF